MSLDFLEICIETAKYMLTLHTNTSTSPLIVANPVIIAVYKQCHEYKWPANSVGNECQVGMAVIQIACFVRILPQPLEIASYSMIMKNLNLTALLTLHVTVACCLAIENTTWIYKFIEQLSRQYRHDTFAMEWAEINLRQAAATKGVICRLIYVVVDRSHSVEVQKQ